VGHKTANVAGFICRSFIMTKKTLILIVAIFCLACFVFCFGQQQRYKFNFLGELLFCKNQCICRYDNIDIYKRTGYKTSAKSHPGRLKKAAKIGFAERLVPPIAAPKEHNPDRLKPARQQAAQLSGYFLACHVQMLVE